jgi:hypothetical protein
LYHPRPRNENIARRLRTIASPSLQRPSPQRDEFPARLRWSVTTRHSPAGDRPRASGQDASVQTDLSFRIRRIGARVSGRLPGRPRGAAVASALAFSLLVPVLAHAQVATEADIRGVGVRDRARPDYDALGIRIGQFMAYPELDLGSSYESNIFGDENNPKGDVLFEITPSMRVESDWANHELGVHATGTIDRYVDTSSQNFEDFDVGADGRLDIDRTANLTGAFDYGRVTESQIDSDFGATLREPIQYNLTKFQVGAHKQFNRLTFNGSYVRAHYAYDNSSGGGAIAVSQLNRNVSVVTGRASYEVSPDTHVFLQGVYNTRSYRLKPPQTPLNRDSQGYDATLGIQFMLTNLIRAELAGGYLAQYFKDGPRSSVQKPSVRGKVEWFPTALTTVTANIDRKVEDSDTVTAQAYIDFGGGLQIDHELRRNIILTVRGQYDNDDYIGIDRRDQVKVGRVYATYQLNREVGLELGYTRTGRSSSGPDGGRDYVDNLVSLTVSLRR